MNISSKGNTIVVPDDRAIVYAIQYDGTKIKVDAQTISSIEDIDNQADRYNIYSLDRKIYIKDYTDKFLVYNINGEEIKNENLYNGIYIVKLKDYIQKVVICE